jgi:hypothetical protein
VVLSAVNKNSRTPCPRKESTMRDPRRYVPWVWLAIAIAYLAKMHMNDDVLSDEMAFVVCMICAQIWTASLGRYY